MTFEELEINEIIFNYNKKYLLIIFLHTFYHKIRNKFQQITFWNSSPLFDNEMISYTMCNFNLLTIDTSVVLLHYNYFNNQYKIIMEADYYRKREDYFVLNMINHHCSLVLIILNMFFIFQTAKRFVKTWTPGNVFSGRFLSDIGQTFQFFASLFRTLK